MTMLADADRGLLVQLADMSVHHGYRQQILAILQALFFLGPDESLRATRHAFLLFGLDDITDAWARLVRATGL